MSQKSQNFLTNFVKLGLQFNTFDSFHARCANSLSIELRREVSGVEREAFTPEIPRNRMRTGEFTIQTAERTDEGFVMVRCWAQTNAQPSDTDWRSVISSFVAAIACGLRLTEEGSVARDFRMTLVRKGRWTSPTHENVHVQKQARGAGARCVVRDESVIVLFNMHLEGIYCRALSGYRGSHDMLAVN
jgi:hypothetical protein